MEHKWGWRRLIGERTREIGIHPKEALALKADPARAKTWLVASGTLVALVNGDLIIRHCGGDPIHVPAGSIHAMANYGPDTAIVKQIYTAPKDSLKEKLAVKRFRDPQRGRACTDVLPDDLAALKSLCLYDAVLNCISKPDK